MTTIRRGPFAVHRLIDCGRDIALVRYDGDPDVFTALAAEFLYLKGIEGRTIEAPEPGLFRMNVCNSDEYGWAVGRPTKPGRGTFTGAILTLARRGELGRYAPFGCWRCEAKVYERHLTSCLENWGVREMAPGTSVTDEDGRRVWRTSAALTRPWIDNETGVRYSHDAVALMVAAGAEVRGPFRNELAAV
jgi:hypothetical protein